MVPAFPGCAEVTAPRRYFAPCPKGLEYLLRDELVALGASSVREALAGVHFEGDARVGYVACLWSRLASRILLTLVEFPASDGEALYRGVAALDWSFHLAADATLAVSAHGHTRGIDNTQYAALRVKDAIVDQFRERTGTRPSVDTERPALRLNLVLRQGKGTLSIDLAGGSLHQRGYRFGAGEAPLKENLAAAMLERAQWRAAYAAGGALVDPMCGSGTLLIEGALMAADVAPGLLRAHWGFSGWRGHDPEVWAEVLAAAHERARAGLKALRPVFFGNDVNAAVLGAAKQNAQLAGVAGFFKLSHVPVVRLEAPPTQAPGLVICNPPYGERMGDADELAGVYRELGQALKRGFAGWRAAVITNSTELGHAIGLKAQRRYQLMNGALECTLYCFDTITAGELRERGERPLSPAAQELANRLAKNLKHLKPRLARESIACYRAYDADLPEYSAAIDVYCGYVHVQEYAPPAEIPEEKARRRLEEIVEVAARVLDVPRDRVAVKTRRIQSRTDKYQRRDRRNELVEIEEGGLKFLVNLTDFLDTGLFLDHRPLRARIRDLARGKRFLNLFCYTGTATVYAAAGGAVQTTSVDLSGAYLEWAERNLTLNGLDGDAHRLVQADTLAWLAAERGIYELIYVDPPTFSNSKRADDFDVQRDHVRLLSLCAARLAPQGLILFSNNFRRFKIDRAALEAQGLSVLDTTRATIPFDFARNPKIHQAFELRRA